jgi:hypothetical protein
MSYIEDDDAEREEFRQQLNDADHQRIEFLRSRKTSFERVFNGKGTPDDVKIVLEDLGRFCRSNESTFHPDERMAAMLDGRREVWLRISDHLRLSTEELFEKYHRRGAQQNV